MSDRSNLYRPSNGSEFEAFTEGYCMQCIHCNPDPSGDKQCRVLLLAMLFKESDPEYPEEWRYDAMGSPECSKWERWVWELQGDPDDPNNPNRKKKDDSNQLTLF